LGGTEDFEGDFWREDRNVLIKWGWIKNKDKSELANVIHTKFKSKEDVKKWFADPNNRNEYSTLSDREWEGFYQHAYEDAGHEASSSDQLYYSPFEYTLFTVTGGNRPNSTLALYQDIAPAVVMLSGGVLLTDYIVGLTFRMIENGYDNIKEKGWNNQLDESLNADVKQIGTEAALSIPAFADPTLLSQTVLTVLSIAGHLRHSLFGN
jgi:heme-degrading monooxygenase HmoA